MQRLDRSTKISKVTTDQQQSSSSTPLTENNNVVFFFLRFCLYELHLVISSLITTGPRSISPAPDRSLTASSVSWRTEC